MDDRSMVAPSEQALEEGIHYTCTFDRYIRSQENAEERHCSRASAAATHIESHAGDHSLELQLVVQREMVGRPCAPAPQVSSVLAASRAA